MYKTLLGCALLASVTAHAQLPELVKDINTTASINSAPAMGSNNNIAYNNKVLFLADDGVNGRELWISDGTAAGTKMVQNSNVLFDGSFDYPVLYNGKVIYRGTDNDHSAEMWMTDGTDAGTSMVKDICPGIITSTPANFTVLNSKVLFFADDHINGQELRITDGTSSNTGMIKDIKTGADGSVTAITVSIVFNGKFYFVADDGTNGSELWVSDGTAAGTKMVKDINPGAASSTPYAFYVFGSKLYFGAKDASGNELWATDGTTTARVKDINPGAADGVPGNFIDYNGKLYFNATQAGSGAELWVTDGTDAGTVMVKDIYAGNNSGSPKEFCVYHNKLYFSATDAANQQLWVSDGTPAGTTLFKTLNPSGFGAPSRLTVYHDKLYFIGTSASLQTQLWVTDGNADSTKILRPASATSTTKGLRGFPFVIAGESLFFVANYIDATGYELYKLTTPSTGVASLPQLTGVTLYPNPTKDAVTIQYTLTEAGTPTYMLYDITGKCVASWVNEGMQSASKHTRQLNIANLPPSTYQLQVAVNGVQQTLRVVKE